METPLVSIIIPTYNRAHLIGETLDSVIAQTYTNWECIVVDDGSTDNTDEVMAAYVAKDPRFRYFHRPDTHKSGGNGARNYGFKMSKGAYVQWFDSDDLMTDNKLALNVNAFQQFDVDVVFNLFKEFPDNIKTDNFGLYDESLGLFENLVCKKIKINTPSSIWSRKAITEDFLFDENILKGQELDFYSRYFFHHTPSFKIIKETTSLIRKHESGILVDFYKMKNPKMIESFLFVRRRIHKMANMTNNPNVIECALMFYEHIIVDIIKKNNYNLALKEISFLLKNPPDVLVSKYKRRFLKYLIFINLLKLSKGKGFYKFKQILNIK